MEDSAFAPNEAHRLGEALLRRNGTAREDGLLKSLRRRSRLPCSGRLDRLDATRPRRARLQVLEGRRPTKPVAKSPSFFRLEKDSSLRTEATLEASFSPTLQCLDARRLARRGGFDRNAEPSGLSRRGFRGWLLEQMRVRRNLKPRGQQSHLTRQSDASAARRRVAQTATSREAGLPTFPPFKQIFAPFLRRVSKHFAWGTRLGTL